MSFDWYTTTQGEANLQLEYTTNGSTWINAPISIGSNSTEGLASLTNSTSANTVTGSYISDNKLTNGSQAGQDWFQGLTATISDSNAANNPNFAIRLVNASTGADCVSTQGTALNNTSGNWRFDNIQIGGIAIPQPTIGTNPTSLTVPAGTPVTLTATASGTPTPTESWQVSTNGGSSYSPITSGVGGYTVVPNGNLQFTANEGLTGDMYEAVFSNSLGGSATSTPATLTVIGTPITAWNFNSSQVIGAPASGSLAQGLGNSPYASVDNVGPVSGPVDVPLGLKNNYTGLQSFPEADNVPVASAVNPAFVPVVWRLRGGGGGGAGGSPGVPEGWSQQAPQYDNTTVTLADPTNVQGAQWTLSTVGYDNVTLHFDWQQGGIADLQPQYYNGSAWVNVPWATGDTGLNITPGGNPANGGSPVDPTGGDLIQATGSDYYGLTSKTGAAHWCLRQPPGHCRRR